jgi:hypothetical protein
VVGGDGGAGTAGGLDFFVSYAGPDQEWAIWIAQELQDAGHAVELDVWSWSAGSDFIDATRQAMERASRLIAVWSPDYFVRRWADMEHRAAFVAAQTTPGWLIPVLVRSCPDEAIPRLYRTLIRIDLVGADVTEARSRLLRGVAGAARPGTDVPFPGNAGRRGYPGRLPPVWNVPGRNHFFTGRDGLLADLHSQLSGAGAAAVTIGAPREEGGTGKSGLAIEYAWRYAGDYHLVWWVDASHRATGEASMVELAALLGVPVAGGAAAVIAALHAELAARADWLLILDGVAGPAHLAGLLPPRSGHVIVTSRDPGLGECRIVVGRFSRAESVQLLCQRCPGLAHAAAARIAAAVDDLPLSVWHAGAFLARTGMAAEEYLPRLVGHTPAAGGAGPGSDPVADAGLAATVAVALERLADLDPAAVDLLEQLALLAAEPVPLTAAVAPAGPAAGLVVGDPQTTGEIVAGITGLGLAALSGTQLRRHARVHAAIAAGMSPQRRVLALGRVLRLLVTADPGDPGRPANWPLYAALTPHMLAAAQHLHDHPGVTGSAAFEDLLHGFWRYLVLTGQAAAGHDLAEATERHQRALGDDRPQAIRWSTNLGVSLNALGRHPAARQVLAAAMDRVRRHGGFDHAATLRLAHHHAVALLALGDVVAAQRQLLDTLGRRRQVLGPDAPETLATATWLGIAMAARGYHEQARRVLEDAAQRRGRVLGADHVDTLASGHQLGSVLAELGDHGAARRVLAEVAGRRGRVLGADHVDTLASGHRLGLVLAELGDHGAARRVLVEVAGRRGRVLGADHVDTLASGHRLGLVLAELGDHGAARRVLADVAGRRRRVLGADHPDALASAHHLGLAHAAHGDHVAAWAVLDETFRRRRRLLGPSHPDTLRTEAARRGLWPAPAPGC